MGDLFNVEDSALVDSTKMNCKEAKLVAEQLSQLIISEDSSYSQDEEVAKEIDTMLIKLSEFLDVIDLIRSDTNLCLKTTIPLITEKAQHLDDICNRIDQLEMFVGIVEKTLERLEGQTKEAESHFSTIKNIKKSLSGMFSKIGRRHQEPRAQHSQSSSSQSTTEYQSVMIFSTEQIFGEADGEAELKPAHCPDSNSTTETTLESDTDDVKAREEPGIEPNESEAS